MIFFVDFSDFLHEEKHEPGKAIEECGVVLIVDQADEIEVFHAFLEFVDIA